MGIKQKQQLSVVIIALNEKHNIERAIRSVDWADEVLVYDSGSTDGTQDIAKKLGATVCEGSWLGFGKTKEAATRLAKHDWILSIDSDEEVSEELKKEIMQKMGSLNAKVAYRLPRLSYYLKTWIRHGGWFPDYQTRLFNRKESMWNSADIHEKVEAKQYEVFVSHLNHYVFESIEHQAQTNNKYSTLQAREMHKNGKSFSWFHFFTKPGVKFIECYFLKLGFLDGWAGFVIARSAAYSVFLKWSKLYEIQKLN